MKTASTKIVHKAAEASGEFLGNKIADKIVKPKPESDMNSRYVEEIVIPPEEREEILNELRQTEHYKMSKMSTVSKFVPKNWIKVNDLSGGQ